MRRSLRRPTFLTRAVLIITCALTLVLACAADPLTIGVNCGGNQVGTISVQVSASGAGITGGFTSTVGGPPATLAAAAAACGENHFNWYQVVTADNKVPNDSHGNPVNPPYVDPPPGGYSNQWADSLPWYWDEYAPPAGTPNFDANLLLSNQTGLTTLNFSDFPGGAAGTNLSFVTFLVSLNADSSFHAFEGGFSWTWSNSTGSAVATAPQLIQGGAPTDAQYRNIIGGFNTSIPEPSSMVLFASGALSLFGYKIRRRL